MTTEALLKLVTGKRYKLKIHGVTHVVMYGGVGYFYDERSMRIHESYIKDRYLTMYK